MSFNVTPKDAPASANSNSQQPSARERAIAAFNKMSATQNAQETPPEVLMAQAAANRTPPTGEIRQDDTSGSTEQEPAKEAAAPEAPKPEATEKALSPQYAALARKEKALRAQVQQFKQEQATFKQQMDQFQAQKAEIDRKLAMLDRLDKDPWSVLNEKGVTYDQITAQVLSQPSAQDQAIAKLEAQIKAQNDAIERQQKAAEQQQTEQYQQAVNQIRFEAKTLVANNPEFEMVKATNSVNDVVELIEKTFKEDQVLLTVEEAAQMVEEYLTDEALRIAKVNKIQQRLKPAASPAAQPKQQQPASTVQRTAGNQPVKTLTNAVGTSPKLSRRERAILAFEGKLSK